MTRKLAGLPVTDRDRCIALHQQAGKWATHHIAATNHRDLHSFDRNAEIVQQLDSALGCAWSERRKTHVQAAGIGWSDAINVLQWRKVFKHRLGAKMFWERHQ